MRRFTSAAPVRFLLSGGLNTLATYLIYLALVRVLQYQVAYTVTYVIGIVLSYFLNALWVFRSRPTARTALMFPVAYLGQYLVGVALLSVCVSVLGIDKRLAPLVVIAVTVPLMYVLSRFVFQSKPAKHDQANR
ncbi:GtrA family protein [Caballeronia sp. LZ034LL]|uniref:GtrA family protein n=1 Tax=Caballeronia sp. LZ034LL TaxID=3038567 RepID=UPI002861957D|nr:GtrA family protein [Caballeronia sp. LZ034LL]MDR5834607.1 GtrA family protein [Caballeronia sp. LZ034LL]